MPVDRNLHPRAHRGIRSKETDPLGTTGAISEDVHIRDLVFAMGACTQTNYVKEFRTSGRLRSDRRLWSLIKAVFNAEQENLPYHVGNVLTSDLFYEPEKKKHDGLQFADMGVLAVEMETAALYANAALGKRGHSPS